jgi:hypothetical protein
MELQNEDNLMVNRALVVYGRKILSVALIFNALMSIVFAIQLLMGYYVANWKVYAPYLVDSSLFWAIILASIINVFPAATIGKVRTGRLWFHHYIYGLAVTLSSTGLVLFLTPVSLTNLLMEHTTDTTINGARFFILGGLALLLDDLPDVSKRIKSILSLAKSEVYKRRKTVHVIQGLMGFVSLYIFIAVTVYVTQNPAEATLANLILIGTLLVTSLTSFASVKRKTWLNVTSEEVGSH